MVSKWQNVKPPYNYGATFAYQTSAAGIGRNRFWGGPPFFEPYEYNNKLRNIPFFMVFNIEKTGVDRWWKSPISGPLFLKKYQPEITAIALSNIPKSSPINMSHIESMLCINTWWNRYPMFYPKSHIKGDRPKPQVTTASAQGPSSPLEERGYDLSWVAPVMRVVKVTSLGSKGGSLFTRWVLSLLLW